MKKLLMAPLILLGACATCCALPLLAPLLAGLLTSGISSAFGGWQIGLVAALVQVVRRRSRPVHSAASCQVACKSPRDAAPCSCHTEPQA